MSEDERPGEGHMKIDKGTSGKIERLSSRQGGAR